MALTEMVEMDGLREGMKGCGQRRSRESCIISLTFYHHMQAILYQYRYTRFGRSPNRRYSFSMQQGERGMMALMHEALMVVVEC